MKKVFLAISIFLLIDYSYAKGKDVVIPETRPMFVDIWSGFYTGISAGYLKGKDDFKGVHKKNIDLIDLGKEGFKTTDINPSGKSIGLFIGYNKLFTSNYIIGIEGRFNYANVSDNNYVKTIKGELTDTVFDLKHKNDAALYLRFGKVFDNKYMPYLLIGGSCSNLYATLKSNTQNFTDKTRDISLTSGAGLEISLNSNWNIRFQYSATDYGNVKFKYNISNVPVKVKIKYKTHIFNTGISYKFN